MRRRVFLAAAVMILVGGLAITADRSAEAAFPGANGKIVFSSDRDGNFEIYSMNVDGSGQTNLSNNPAIDTDPAWSPDGRQIAFSSDRGGSTNIYKMNADGSAQTRLTGGSYPAWTSDGRIAFQRRPTAGGSCPASTEVYVINADGTGETNVSNDPARDCLPAGSSTGRIAFASDRHGNLEIYTVDPDGARLARVTNNPAFDVSPNWSPDATRLAFLRGAPRASLYDLYVIKPDGRGELNLTNTPSRDEGTPTWSARGDRIAFVGCTPTGDCQIFMMNPDGSGEVQLTFAGYNSKPDWHPLPQPPPPVRCRVPNVLGLPLPRAGARIRARNCTVGSVRPARSRRSLRPLVTGQKPPGGAVRRRGFPVNLVVGRR